jgi:hypothetical protein
MSASSFKTIPLDIWNCEISKYLDLDDMICLRNSCSFLRDNLLINKKNDRAISVDVYNKYKDIFDSFNIYKTITVRNIDVDRKLSLKNLIVNSIIVNTSLKIQLDFNNMNTMVDSINLSNVFIKRFHAEEFININHVELYNCYDFSDIYKLQNVSYIRLENCELLKDNERAFPSIPSLRTLYISNTSISDINSLTNLTKLLLRNCYRISEIDNLTNVKDLCLENTRVRNISSLVNLETLEIRGNSIMDLSSNINLKRVNIFSTVIENINFDNLNMLEEVTIFNSMHSRNNCFTKINTNVKKINLSYMTNFDFKYFPNLEDLTINFIHDTEMNTSFLSKLKNLNITDCININTINDLNYLETLVMIRCKVTEIKNNINLKKVRILDCELLETISGCPNIESLDISGTNMRDISEFTLLKELKISSNSIVLDCSIYKKLKVLNLYNYDDVVDLSVVKDSLLSLTIENSKHVCNINNIYNLRYLRLVNSDVTYIDKLVNLTFLACISCKNIIDISSLCKLKFLLLENCKSISRINDVIKTNAYITNCAKLL